VAIYLDANASEPLRPEAREALAAALDVAGNPASVHGSGRRARRLLEDARETIALRFGARPAGVVFCSGGTEANAAAIHALGRGRRLIVGATEHPSILAAAGPAACRIPVDRSGLADLGALETLLGAGGPALVCLMLANNETGTVQPIEAVAGLCRRFGAVLHVDAVQAAGRIATSLEALGADSLVVSSHKLGGPAGAAALLLASGHWNAPALIAGGGQERGRRGGTPATAAIAGFAAAAEAARPEAAERLAPLRAAIEAAAVAAGAVVCGGDARRLPNTTALALAAVRADAQVIALDLAGIEVSAGAACSSGKVEQSHVLTAMGLGDLAAAAIRVSLPWNASDHHVAEFARAYADMAARLRGALAPRAA